MSARTWKLVIAVAAVAAVAFGCEKREPAQQVEAESAAATTPTPAAPGEMPKPGAAPPAAAATGELGGEVIETMDSGGYTYVRFAGEGGDRWAAGPITPIQVGDRVTLRTPMPMKDFTSNTLNRTFAEIDFVEAIDVVGKAAPKPAADRAEPSAAPAGLVGEVTETMDAGGYTYVNVRTADGTEHWAAGPETALSVGARVALPVGTPMTNFKSNTLGRTFDRIEFVGEIPLAGTDPVDDAHAGVAVAPPTALEPVEQLADGQSVAEVIDGKAALANTDVAIRGRVVKVNRSILDRDWLHIQDGSGDVAAGNHDLTVTSADVGAAKPGDVVVVRGKVAVDQDFGAGYSYPVLVEQATVTVEN